MPGPTYVPVSPYGGNFVVPVEGGGELPLVFTLQSQPFPAPTTLVVDPVNGNDANPLGPLKTIAKLNQVLTGAVISAALTVNVLSDVPSSDAKLAFSATVLSGGSIAFAGTPVALRSSVLTAATTSLSSTTNQREILDDTTLPTNGWTAFLGNQVVCTSGPHINVSTYVASNVAGGTTCNAGQPLQPGLTSTSGTLANGDPITVQRGSNLTLGLISIVTDSASTPLSFQQFTFVVRPDGLSCQMSTSAVFLNCSFPGKVGASSGTLTCQNCFLGAGFTCDRLSVAGGVLVTSGNNNTSDTANLLVLSANVYVTGNCVFVGSGTGRVRELQVFSGISGGNGAQFQDCINVNAALIFSTCKMNVGGNVLNQNASAGRVWGSGNTGFGIVCYYGGHVSLLSSAAFTPKITGTAGDFGFDTPHAGGFTNSGEPFDISVPGYAAARTTSWTNWVNNSIAGGGFNFNAHAPDIDAHVIGV